MLEYFDLPLAYRLRFELLNNYYIAPVFRRDIHLPCMKGNNPLLWIRERDLMLDNQQVALCASFRPVAVCRDWNNDRFYLLADSGLRYEITQWSTGISLGEPRSVIGEDNWNYVEIYPSKPVEVKTY